MDFITFDELQTVFSTLGENMSPEKIKEMIQKVDLNHDGKLDFNEFARLWKILQSEDN